jgi:hypothetical protein
MLGLIGEYLGCLFLTSNRTPQFVVREVLGGMDAHETSAAAMSGPHNGARLSRPS